MTILVAGGAGFIGSHLCERLLAEGNTVLCVDNFITGKPENVDHLGRGKFYLITHDITTGTSEVPDVKIDMVYHLASPASPKAYEKYPIETMEANAVGTKNLLDLAAKNDATFVYTSTSEVYGDPTQTPQHETYWGNVNPYGPRGMYDNSKRYAESLIWVYTRAGLNTKIARLFNTYGPRMDPKDGRVIPTFINQALKGEKLTIHGTGTQTRSFCYVTDTVDGLIKLGRANINEPVNIGNPAEISVKELAFDVLDAVNGSVDPTRITYRKAKEDDPMQRKPSIMRARAVLGYEPKTPRVEGLRLTVDYFRNL